MSHRFLVCVALCATPAFLRAETIDADLLIVGGTESGCAAAVQAARMGVKRIVLVNDIAWLGGQFSAEALTAIDENRGPAGYDHTVPIPRHGHFREIIDRIERINDLKFGVPRPGNTRVITTCRPSDAERAFREWLLPYVTSGQIILIENHEPTSVSVADDRVRSVTFADPTGESPLTVNARLTVDASDWGDVIRLSGAAYEFGPDLKAKYGEPLAPENRDGYPITDMNPITYCMVLNETDKYEPIVKPTGYDARNYQSHGYPKDPLWLYESRRLVDHYHFKTIQHPDVLLLCFPAFDYPLDVHPKRLAEALEATEVGASTRNIVELTPAQRRLVFEDAKQYSRGFLYYLQTEVHEKMPDKTHSFRRFVLSDEFGTPDRMPWKPYVRESLRLQAMYMLRQQDTTGVGGDARNAASAMVHDGVLAWQFEYDFHPTKREFLTGDPAGPWRGVFRKGRTWGPPYSGLSLFPLRSLIPAKLDGLLGAQKNLGYSSIVSSAVRLHDQSMAVGQAVGATAAVALKEDVQPRTIPFDREKLVTLQTAIASPLDDGMPGCVWPWRDLEPTHKAFTAANVLAVQGCLPCFADEVTFRPDEKPSRQWMEEVITNTRLQMQAFDNKTKPPFDATTRGEFVTRWWEIVRANTWKPYVRRAEHDFDGDDIPDADDALPLDQENRSLPLMPIDPSADGVPSKVKASRQFNFAGPGTPNVEGFTLDVGAVFDPERGHGWDRDQTKNHRRRGQAATLADTFLFTRDRATWECALPNGTWQVKICVGDAGFPQPGQRVTIEGVRVVDGEETRAGRFLERTQTVEVTDGRLTVSLGPQKAGENTCLNWIQIARERE